MAAAAVAVQPSGMACATAAPCSAARRAATGCTAPPCFRLAHWHVRQGAHRRALHGPRCPAGAGECGADAVGRAPRPSGAAVWGWWPWGAAPASVHQSAGAAVAVAGMRCCWGPAHGTPACMHHCRRALLRPVPPCDASWCAPCPRGTARLQREGIKTYCSNLIIKISTDEKVGGSWGRGRGRRQRWPGRWLAGSGGTAGHAGPPPQVCC